MKYLITDFATDRKVVAEASSKREALVKALEYLFKDDREFESFLNSLEMDVENLNDLEQI